MYLIEMFFDNSVDIFVRLTLGFRVVFLASANDVWVPRILFVDVSRLPAPRGSDVSSVSYAYPRTNGSNEGKIINKKFLLNFLLFEYFQTKNNYITSYISITI